jgi:hypothetical protein
MASAASVGASPTKAAALLPDVLTRRGKMRRGVARSETAAVLLGFSVASLHPRNLRLLSQAAAAAVQIQPTDCQRLSAAPIARRTCVDRRATKLALVAVAAVGAEELQLGKK